MIVHVQRAVVDITAAYHQSEANELHIDLSFRHKTRQSIFIIFSTDYASTKTSSLRFTTTITSPLHIFCFLFAFCTRTKLQPNVTSVFRSKLQIILHQYINTTIYVSYNSNFSLHMCIKCTLLSIKIARQEVQAFSIAHILSIICNNIRHESC